MQRQWVEYWFKCNRNH